MRSLLLTILILVLILSIYPVSIMGQDVPPVGPSGPVYPPKKQPREPREPREPKQPSPSEIINELISGYEDAYREIESIWAGVKSIPEINTRRYPKNISDVIQGLKELSTFCQLHINYLKQNIIARDEMISQRRIRLAKLTEYKKKLREYIEFVQEQAVKLMERSRRVGYEAGELANNVIKLQNNGKLVASTAETAQEDLFLDLDRVARRVGMSVKKPVRQIPDFDMRIKGARMLPWNDVQIPGYKYLPIPAFYDLVKTPPKYPPLDTVKREQEILSQTPPPVLPSAASDLEMAKYLYDDVRRYSTIFSNKVKRLKQLKNTSSELWSQEKELISSAKKPHDEAYDAYYAFGGVYARLISMHRNLKVAMFYDKEVRSQLAYEALRYGMIKQFKREIKPLITMTLGTNTRAIFLLKFESIQRQTIKLAEDALNFLPKAVENLANENPNQYRELQNESQQILERYKIDVSMRYIGLPPYLEKAFRR